MPGPGHVCVCGHRCTTFGNLIAHRKGCDSWQEHVRGTERPECPYCGTDFGNGPLLVAHLRRCNRREAKFLAAFIAPGEASALVAEAEGALADSIHKTQRQAEFERWCEENGRA